MGIFPNKIRTAIEIRETEIKIAQISDSGTGIEVVSCISEEAPSNDARSVAETLQRSLKKNKITAKDVTLVIPRQSVTTKTLSLPSRDPAEREEMAGFQAIKQIPYPKEEIVYGVSPIEASAEGFSKVMLVICHRDAIERPVSILKDCGLVPSRVTLSSFGMMNWFRLNSDLKEAAGAAPVILIECDRTVTDIAVADKDRLIYTRGISFGTAEGGNYAEKLDEEISRTIASFEREALMLKPTLAVFTGDISGLAEHRDLLARSMGLKVELIDPFKPFPAASRFSDSRVSFSSSIGNAIGPDKVDLLPREMRIAHYAKSKRNEFLVSLFLGIAVIMLVSASVLIKIREKEESLKMIDRRLNKIAPAAMDIGKMKAVTDALKSQSAQRSQPLVILNELYRITPPSINLALYRYEGGEIDIKGTASVLSDVFKYVTSLDDSPYFENVEVKYAAKRKIQEIELVDFEIVSKLSNKAKR